jgi:hypothetical protein
VTNEISDGDQETALASMQGARNVHHPRSTRSSPHGARPCSRRGKQQAGALGENQRIKRPDQGHLIRLRPDHEQVILRDGAPALVSSELARSVHVRLERNKVQATRNNKSPKPALLRAGSLGAGTAVGGARSSSREADGCTDVEHKCGSPSFSIMAPILDEAVWSTVEDVLKRPEIITVEVERMPGSDTSQADLESIYRRRTNLTKRLALFDDDDSAAPLVHELQLLSDQRRQLDAEQTTIQDRREGWESAQVRLHDLQHWCQVQARNLDTLAYEQKRLALEAMNVEAHVWASGHDPRYTISLQLDGLVPDAMPSDPLGATDVGLGEGHVDDYSRRGCARRGGRPGGRL